MNILNVEPDQYDAEARAALERLGSVTYRACADQHAFEAALGSAAWDAVIVSLGLALNRAALDRVPALRFIVTPTTGLDHIDEQEAAARNIRVISLRGETEFLTTITATAELTWALLLALVRRLPAALRHVHAGGWDRTLFLGDELSGKTLGIVGHGRLGRLVAGYGRAFGMRVIAFDSDPRALVGVDAVDLDALLAAADVVSLHLPLNDTTRGFLSAARIASMKKGALLINTARGELIDEAALVAALSSGNLAGAGVDVLAGDARWDGGAQGASAVLGFAQTHDNVLITPHIGGYGRQAIARTRRFIIDKLARAAAVT